MVLEHSVASRFSSINAERILTFLYAHDIDINNLLETQSNIPMNTNENKKIIHIHANEVHV